MKQLPKAYEHQVVDSKWYKFWKDRGFFKADPHSSKPKFSIAIPPPNVTGKLHMGHALVNTLQDIVVRWKRMSGFETLWTPGTDHAGIATQTVVERHLTKTMGKRRSDFEREEFIGHIWRWKEENEGNILNQLMRLGCSCDWSRLRFTMDENNNRAVRTMFKKLFEEGLIYRGDYLVNWDPVAQTAIADDEVEYEERQSFIWTLKYPLKDGGFAKVATTRPETLLGDTAIAVNPKDERFQHLIGQVALHPFFEREIPIIADNKIDPLFGTGMVKITPAHDPNDYEMGQRHNLAFINIMTSDGRLNEAAGPFAGLTMPEGREAVVQGMMKQGLLEKVEPHVNRVGVSYRSKATIEPYLSKQWFIRMGGFAKSMRDAVAQDKVALIPEQWKSTYFHWIDHLRDWCISRQLWWGHRIPIWYRQDDPERMICFDGEGVPPEVAAAPEDWIQDGDVLDTWFSSALWPFATLGWPNKTEELKAFYPNSLLITGHDILFFWVARMIMMGEFAMGQVPFPKVFLHGLIYGKSYWRKLAGGGISYISQEERAEYDLGKPLPADVEGKWEKMSKSKGNIIDPLEMIDVYGTDAVRMAMAASATHAREIDLDRRRFEDFKNFSNKVWNGARFVLMNLAESEENHQASLSPEQFAEGIDESLLSLEDLWLLSRFNKVIADVNRHLENYAFDQAANRAYDFFWNEFCAYYVEMAKPVLFGKAGSKEERCNKQKLLGITLTMAVRLLHPMAPYITEELFQTLKEQFGNASEIATADPYTKEALAALQCEACIVSPYPRIVRAEDANEKIEEDFQLVVDIVYSVRNIRGEMKIPPGIVTDLFLIADLRSKEMSCLKENEQILRALLRLRDIHYQENDTASGPTATSMARGVKISVPIPKELIEQELTRLNKERDRLHTSLERLSNQLANEEYVQRAPQALVEKQRNQLAAAQEELKALEDKINQWSLS